MPGVIESGCLPCSNNKMLPQHKNVQLFSATSINQLFKGPVNQSDFIWQPHRNLLWKHLESTGLIYLRFRNDVALTDKVTIRQLLIVRRQPKFQVLNKGDKMGMISLVFSKKPCSHISDLEAL